MQIDQLCNYFATLFDNPQESFSYLYNKEVQFKMNFLKLLKFLYNETSWCFLSITEN